MAITPPSAPRTGKKQLTPIGAHRRIQALVAAGFGLKAQDAHRGVSKSSTWNILRRQQHIQSRTFLLVADMYRELWDANPADHGVPDQAVRRAKSLAFANRWAPPGCWDDDTIDDPDAFPEWTGCCGSRRGYSIHLREKIPVCEPCRLAYAEARRVERNRTSTLKETDAETLVA